MWRIFILLFLCPILAGCATARAVRYPTNYYSPTDPNNVGVYYNFPPGDYEVIGEVEGSGAPAASWEQVSIYMRQEAAKIGGDAVIIQQTETPYRGTYHSPGRVYKDTTGYWLGRFYHEDSTYRSSPGYSMPMYGKYVRGVVIKFKSVYKTEGIYTTVSPKLATCPNGHQIDITGLPLGTDVRCPICNNVFTFGSKTSTNEISDSEPVKKRFQETSVLKDPQGHLLLPGEGATEIKGEVNIETTTISQPQDIPVIVGQEQKEDSKSLEDRGEDRKQKNLNRRSKRR